MGTWNLGGICKGSQGLLWGLSAVERLASHSPKLVPSVGQPSSHLCPVDNTDVVPAHLAVTPGSDGQGIAVDLAGCWSMGRGQQVGTVTPHSLVTRELPAGPDTQGPRMVTTGSCSHIHHPPPGMWPDLGSSGVRVPSDRFTSCMDEGNLREPPSSLCASPAGTRAA